MQARRGVDHILTPRDFALARGWYRRAATAGHGAGGHGPGVREGGDRDLARPTAAARSRSWRPPVRRPRPRPAPPSESVPLAEVSELLARSASDCRRCPRCPAPPLNPPLRKIMEVRDLLAVASRPNWSYLREKLREIDDDVSAAALQALPETESCRVCSRRRAAPSSATADGVDDAALRGRQGPLHPPARPGAPGLTPGQSASERVPLAHEAPWLVSALELMLL